MSDQLDEIATIRQRLQQEIVNRQQAETEREQLQQQLAIERSGLQTFLLQLPAGVIVADRTGKTILISRQAKQILSGAASPAEGIEQFVQSAVVHRDGTPLQPEASPLARSLITGEVVNEQEINFLRTDGSQGILQVSSVPLRNGEEISTAVMIFQDITERKQTEQALSRYQLLSEHSRDIVLYLNLDGQILEANQAAVTAYGYDRAELLTRTIADLRDPQTQGSLDQQFQQAINQGILFETVHRRRDGHLFPVEVSSQSTVTNGETVVLSIIRDITERQAALGERLLAEQEREQLLAREQAARAEAEAAERRARFLAEASTTLASSLNYEQTLKRVAQLAVPTLADWCVVDILTDDRRLERLATTHVDPAKVEWAAELHRRYPPDLDTAQGIANVLRTGKPQCYPEISDAQLVAAARDAEHLQILREIGFHSVMIVPLIARNKILGSISFVSAESSYSYDLDDLSLAQELAQRAAICLDNARLYQEAQQAQQIAERAADRTARLQAVTAALSESLTPLQVAEVIVDQSIAALQANAAVIALLTEDRSELEIVRIVGYPTAWAESWRRFSVHTAVPLAEAVRTGKPLWTEPQAARMDRYPHLAEIYKRFDFAAWISLPLILEGKPIGGLSLSFKQYRELSQDDRDFILALTQQCTQAIARAQLYEAERQARAEAEQANRIKDEFLAVLSHELRSPLNPILGWTKLLRTHQLNAAKTEQALETIERNAKLQAQLVEDLLDVSRILQGKLSLEVVPVDLSAVIAAAIETIRLAADTKSIQIQTRLQFGDRLVMGDANRLQQVMWNLLSNAVKFTPIGGQINIQLQDVNNQAQIQVTDTGKGIQPDFLPYVFDTFRQADSGTTRKFGGLGLGLAIVRQVVELHGGTVAVESPGEGLGATFTVKLPLTEAQPQATPSDRLQADLVDLTNVKVLVVDDDPDMRSLAFFLLTQHGAEVTTAANAAEALTLLSQTSPNIVLSDIGMPEMDGYQLMQQIRRLPPTQGGQIPAIALTAYAGEYDQRQALAAGFQIHLAKPVDPALLVRAIATLLQLPNV